ncbi:MAG: hypothetical protein KAI85_16955 [Halopseudomonas aestusnigri]|nr:hypothetical protein [Halopseudomonas aestusnigri]
MDFIPFDYKQPPEEGIYWVAGKRPQFEISADLYGEPTDILTGAEDHYTALVSIRTSEQGMVDFGVIERINLGEVDPLDRVTHYAPFVRPCHPHASRSVKQIAVV